MIFENKKDGRRRHFEIYKKNVNYFRSVHPILIKFNMELALTPQGVKVTFFSKSKMVEDKNKTKIYKISNNFKNGCHICTNFDN